LEYICNPKLDCGQYANTVQTYRTSHRPIGDRRYAAPRVVFVFVAAMCFAQAVSAEHFHATDDVDQTCVICRFSDNHDTLVPSSVEITIPLLFYAQAAELYTRVRVEASFGYRARAPPFSSYA